MKAMVFAAGLGTRLKEETQNKPKALVGIGGKPMLQHTIEKLKNESFSEVVVNVHHFSDLVIEFINSHDFGIPVLISDETDKLLDTGGGLKKAAPFFKGDEPVLIYNVDVISNLKLQNVIEYHNNAGALATLVVKDRKTQRYFKFDSKKRLVGWINKKSGEKKIAIPENFEQSAAMAFSGIHVVSPDIFDLMPADEKFSITDFYLDLAKNHLLKGYFDESEIWMDVGKPEELTEVRKLFQ
jgi:NDP-sugar pyrophosphorylase family protein